jgi:uncharacterized membrane protein
MIIFAGNAKERFATIGALMSLCALLASSARLIYVGEGWGFAFAFIHILTGAAIVKGVKLGYVAGRFVFGALAILLTAGTLNPFSYADVARAGGSFVYSILKSVPLILLFLFLFYSLGEHGKLRGMK